MRTDCTLRRCPPDIEDEEPEPDEPEEADPDVLLPEVLPVLPVVPEPDVVPPVVEPEPDELERSSVPVTSISCPTWLRSSLSRPSRM
jgi:hypothetical protein